MNPQIQSLSPRTPSAEQGHRSPTDLTPSLPLPLSLSPRPNNKTRKAPLQIITLTLTLTLTLPPSHTRGCLLRHAHNNLSTAVGQTLSAQSLQCLARPRPQTPQLLASDISRSMASRLLSRSLARSSAGALRLTSAAPPHTPPLLKSYRPRNLTLVADRYQQHSRAYAAATLQAVEVDDEAVEQLSEVLQFPPYPSPPLSLSTSLASFQSSCN